MGDADRERVGSTPRRKEALVTTVSDPTAAALITTYQADGQQVQEGPAGNGEGSAAAVETEAAPAPAAAAAPAPPTPVPVPPFPVPILRKRLVHGRYRSSGAGYQL